LLALVGHGRQRERTERGGESNGEKPMKTRTGHDAKHTAPRRLVTTIGELVSAAYEAVPGLGAQRAERARDLLTRSPLARHLSPHVEFVR
jgi:hypothetical protein